MDERNKQNIANPQRRDGKTNQQNGVYVSRNMQRRISNARQNQPSGRVQQGNQRPQNNAGGVRAGVQRPAPNGQVRQTPRGGAVQRAVTREVAAPVKGDNALLDLDGNVVSGDTGIRALVTRQKVKALAKNNEWEHQSVERVRTGFDSVFLCLAMAILLLGTIMVCSASYPSAIVQKDDGLYYLKKQLIFVALGFVTMMVISFMPYKLFKKAAIPAYAVSLGLLAIVLVIGISRGDAKRWIGVGSFTLQPSEIAKVGVVIMLAWYYDKFSEKIRDKSNFKSILFYDILFPGIIVAVVLGLIVAEPHYSCVIIIGIISYIMMLVGGSHKVWLTVVCILLAVLLLFGLLMFTPYAKERIDSFFSEEEDTLDADWQTNQGLNAIGSGGLLGVGLGDSVQKYSYVSEAQNDFIFTIWCEEMGFVGAVFLIALYVAMIWRGFIIALRAPDKFSALLVAGIILQIGVQTFLNMAVVTDLVPNTGISLPLFSCGGSATVILMAEIGLVLSVSRHSYQKK